jgi:hypothetical protein
MKTTIKSFCPRINAIKLLDFLIQSLQKQGHAIILVVDVNQTRKECYSQKDVTHKP